MSSTYLDLSTLPDFIREQIKSVVESNDHNFNDHTIELDGMYINAAHSYPHPYTPSFFAYACTKPEFKRGNSVFSAYDLLDDTIEGYSETLTIKDELTKEIAELNKEKDDLEIVIKKQEQEIEELAAAHEELEEKLAEIEEHIECLSTDDSTADIYQELCIILKLKN